MSRGDKLISDWHRLGAGLSVQFSLGDKQIQCEWNPRQPTKREFKRLLPAYREARNSFLAAYANHLGGNVLLVEVGR